MKLTRDQKLNRWFVVHSGVVPLGALLELGFSRRGVYSMVDGKELIVLQPGVFLSAQYPRDELQMQIAVCMRNPRIVIAFLTAARHWTYRSLPKDRLLHILVPHACSPQLKGGGIVVHRCRQIDPADVVELTNGMRVTSPSRTLLDIADSVGDIVATSILEQLINEGRGSLAHHVATLTRLGHAQRPGTPTLARVIAARPRGSRALQSELETRVLTEIHRQQLPEPVTQHELSIGDGRTIRFDFAWPKFKVALEVDHPFWHAGAEQSHNDKWRDRKAAVEGWSTHRVTSLDVAGGLGEAIADVGRILAMATSAA